MEGGQTSIAMRMPRSDLFPFAMVPAWILERLFEAQIKLWSEDIRER